MLAGPERSLPVPTAGWGSGRFLTYNSLLSCVCHYRRSQLFCIRKSPLAGTKESENTIYSIYTGATNRIGVVGCILPRGPCGDHTVLRINIGGP